MRHFRNIAFLLLLVILAACEEDVKILERPGKAIEDYSKVQTLLMYMIADNNLSSFISQDLQECCQGYQNAPGKMNLLVYIDNYANNSGLPMLMNIRRTELHDSLIYDTLHVWNPDHNSASKNIMSDVVREAFNGKFNTPVKGIVLSSHGYAWTPSSRFTAASSRNNSSTGNAEPQWFGQDNAPTTSYMEIWDLHDGLKNSGVELTHIMFDACFMSNAETAYELRDCARYMIASACEIFGDGYNYRKVIPELSKLTDKDQLQDVLSKVIDCYGDEYNDNCDATGELCLLDLSYMDYIAAAYKDVRNGKTLNENVVISTDSLSTSGKPLARMQSYGRFYVGSYYDYFDLVECASKLGDAEPIIALMTSAVIREFHASKFRAVKEHQASGARVKGTDSESFPFTSCSGLSVSLPEMFGYGDRYISTSLSHPTSGQMKSAYAKTQWGKYMGL